MKGASKLTLSQALAIKANNYTSKDCKRDYQAEEIEERILELSSRASDKKINAIMRELEKAPAPPSNPSSTFNPSSPRKLELAESGNNKAARPIDDYRLEAYSIIKDYWRVYKENGFSFEDIEVPPVICNF